MKLSYLFPSALALVATPALAQVMTPTDYVKTSGASDLYEQQSSTLVLETSQDPKVRAFAQMMITHHTQSTADIKAAAAKVKLKVAPPVLTPLQTELVTQLRTEKGPARDARYIAQQRAARGQALTVQTAYASEGTSTPLKATAARIAPVVQQHIQELMKM